MSYHSPRRAQVERLVKENVAAMDKAIAFLRKHNMAETADKLAYIRDYLAHSESYYRRIEGFVVRQEKRAGSPVNRAERIWRDVTGERKK